MAVDRPEGPERMSGRTFIGACALCGFIVGIMISPGISDDLAVEAAHRAGWGVPYAIIGVVIGAVVQFLFRSGRTNK